MARASRLETAIIKKDVAAVQRLLAEGADPDALFQDTRSALFYAVSDSLEITRLLLAAGADVSQRDQLGATPLHCAGNVKIAAMLVEAGAETDVEDEYGSTPLSRAVSGGNSDIVKFLPDRGSDPNRTSSHGDGESLLGFACLQGMQQVDGGADPNIANVGGVTPLMDAAQAGKDRCAAIARLLIAAGAQLNAQMSDGRFPLMWHATEGSAESVRVLVDAGADLNQHDGEGETALAAAIYEGRADTTAVLIAAGADPDLRISTAHEDPGRRGKTPRELARASRNRKIRSLLKPQ